MFRKITIRSRIMLLLVTSLLLLGGVSAVFYTMTKALATFSSTSARNIYFDQEKRRIRDATIIMAKAISNQIAQMTEQGQKIQGIRTTIAENVYEEDKSGYFFVYSMQGDVIAHNNQALVAKTCKTLRMSMEYISTHFWGKRQKGVEAL